MKKILNAVDGNSKVEAVESSDMKKFLSVVVEGKNTSTNRLSMAEQMAVQQYTPTASKAITNPVLNVSKDAKPSMVGKYFKQIEEEIAEAQDRSKQRAKLIAELAINKMNKKNVKDVSEAGSPAQQAAIAINMKKNHKKPKNMKEFAEKPESEQPANNSVNGTVQKVVSKVSNTLSNALPKAMRPFDNDTAANTVAKYKKAQTKEGLAEHIIALTAMRNKLDEEIRQMTEYYTAPTPDSKSPIPGDHVDGCKCQEVEEGLRDPKDNPCWKGYKPVGTKKKGGRTVPNCVPKESVAEDSTPKGYDSDGNPQGGGYDEYENNWLVTVDGKSWKTFDDEKQAYKAAAAIERKYGKKTRVHKN